MLHGICLPEELHAEINIRSMVQALVDSNCLHILMAESTHVDTLGKDK